MTNSEKIIFLFNHDAAHQVAHSAGVAKALGAMTGGEKSDARVIIAVGSEHIRQEVAKYISGEDTGQIVWLDLSLPGWLNQTLKLFNRIAPVARLARLYWHRKSLRKAAIIVSTERTCLTLKRHWKKFGGNSSDPKFCYIPHGSGDRNVAVHPALKQFDLCMVSGQKVVDQLVGAGATTPDKCRIIGYSKFDTLRLRKPEKFFDNDNLVFVYNPHFDPHLSSWFTIGPALLKWFAEHGSAFNLIFAPHVMLYRKKLHISPEYKKMRVRPDIPDIAKQVPNILIDVDSERLFDMSYMIAADAYIGDVSSQIYEFLYRPRPCFFIDTHSGKMPDEAPEYDFWRNGPVVKNVEELSQILPDYQSLGVEYRAVQEDRMAYTADNSDPRPAPERGAEAIKAYLQQV